MCPTAFLRYYKTLPFRCGVSEYSLSLEEEERAGLLDEARELQEYEMLLSPPRTPSPKHISAGQPVKWASNPAAHELHGP